MLKGFDPTLAGKHIYALGDLFPPEAAVGTDVVCCINHGDGPSVVLCGGIHGDEYEAQIVLRRLMHALKPENVTGRVVIIPSLNFPAAHDGRRLSAADGMNMNREFPGKENGTPTQQLAAFLYDDIFPACKLLIDVHAGGANCTVVPMVFGFTGPGCPLDDAQLDRLMEQWGYRYVQHVAGVASTSCGASPLAGTTSIEIEGGGGSRLLADEMDIMYDGLIRGLLAYGAVTGIEVAPPPQESVHIDAGPVNQYVAKRTGIVEHLVELNDFVEAGQCIARVHSVDGSYIDDDVLSNVSGYVLRQTSKTFVRAGDFLGNTGSPR